MGERPAVLCLRVEWLQRRLVIESEQRQAGRAPRRGTRRAVLGGAGALAAALGASAAGCGRQISKVPVEISWYSWGPQLPAAWTVGPGLNPRVRVGGPRAGARSAGDAGAAGAGAGAADRRLQRGAGGRHGQDHDRARRPLPRQAEGPGLGRASCRTWWPTTGPQALPLIRGNSLYHLGRLQGAEQPRLLAGVPRSLPGGQLLPGQAVRRPLPVPAAGALRQQVALPGASAAARRSGAAPTGRGRTSWRRPRP